MTPDAFETCLRYHYLAAILIWLQTEPSEPRRDRKPENTQKCKYHIQFFALLLVEFEAGMFLDRFSAFESFRFHSPQFIYFNILRNLFFRAIREKTREKNERALKKRRALSNRSLYIGASVPPPRSGGGTDARASRRRFGTGALH